MEQTKKLNMTAMSDKTNSNTTAKKEEPAWEHKVTMKVSGDRKSTRLNSSHITRSRMPSSA